jgi:hypothetical protein
MRAANLPGLHAWFNDFELEGTGRDAAAQIKRARCHVCAGRQESVNVVEVDDRVLVGILFVRIQSNIRNVRVDQATRADASESRIGVLGIRSS